jgi:hypothetical protein
VSDPIYRRSPLFFCDQCSRPGLFFPSAIVAVAHRVAQLEAITGSDAPRHPPQDRGQVVLSKRRKAFASSAPREAPAATTAEPITQAAYRPLALKGIHDAIRYSFKLRDHTDEL